MTDAAPALLRERSPDTGLREWMDRFIDYWSTKYGLADAISALADNAYAGSRQALGAAVAVFLDAGAADGTLRAGVDADDVLMSLSGIAFAAGRPEQRAQAGRMLDLLMAGLRP